MHPKCTYGQGFAPDPAEDLTMPSDLLAGGEGPLI